MTRPAGAETAPAPRRLARTDPSSLLGSKLMAKPGVNRRNFLKTSAVGATALTLTAASANRVYGANERIGIAFLGVGGRCQQHIDEVLKMVKEGKAVRPVAVCDVWDGDAKLGRGQGRGLYPSAKR